MSRQEFIAAYVEALYWADTGETECGQPSSESNLADESIAKIDKECTAFWDKYYDLISDSPKRAGYDFWLTRNGHGAGFWDGDWPEPDATILTAASKGFGEVDLYQGDDGLICLA